MIRFNSLNQGEPYLTFKQKYCMALDLGQKNIEAIAISSYNIKQNEVDSRFVNLKFIDDDKLMTPLSGSGFWGLPVTGFVVQKFTNAAAQQGLLAQYGSLFVHKGLVVTEEAAAN